MTAAKRKRPSRSARDEDRYHKGNVDRHLFDAASRLIESGELDRLTLRRLCREVGVTAANFYNHYPSLDHLLLDVAAEGLDKLRERLRSRLSRIDAFDERLTAIATGFVEFGVDHPDLFRLMFGQIVDARDHERFRTASELAFEDLVNRVDGEHRYRSDDIAWSHAHCQSGYTLFAFSYGLARLISMGLIEFPSGTRAERTRFVKSLALTLVRGIRVPERRATKSDGDHGATP
ncbi:MAG: TetR/AcrR family transcriptional regulator [Gammaproteobacteria bacterium]|nr:TetR/AcrR family transcriptional regulator [Gammaproteobacteria bacterium]